MAFAWVFFSLPLALFNLACASPSVVSGVCIGVVNVLSGSLFVALYLSRFSIGV